MEYIVLSSEQVEMIVALLNSIRQKITDISEKIEQTDAIINDLDDAIKQAVIYSKPSDN